MVSSRVLRVRIVAMALASVFGAALALAQPLAADGGECETACYGEIQEEGDCPAEESGADDACNENCEGWVSSDTCAMGLCYEGIANQWLIDCEPG